MPLQLRRMRRFDNYPFYLYDVGVNKFMGFAIDEKYLHALREVLPDTQIYLDEPMARHTTFHIGGNADVFVLPSSIEALVHILALAKRFSVPVTILGNGSNVLVQDGGIRGTVISFGKPFSRIERKGTHIKAEAGAALGAVSLFAASHSLQGMEFAVGIPGSLGGAVYMNAGAYDGEMSQIVCAVTAVTPEGEIVRYDASELGFSYRHSIFQDNNAIICEIELVLQEGDVAGIQEKIADFTKRRMEKQPLDKPSAGSTFKRPPGLFAGTLIDKAGLKGLTIGGAQVSEKHAGFVVNIGNATAKDVLSVIEEVQARVKQEHGVVLIPEIRIIGERA